MSKKIKLRAWDNINKFMISWHEIVNYSGLLHRIIENANVDIESDALYDVMQCTNLNDINGKEVYRGDILSFEQRGQIALGTVVMEDGCYFAIIEGQRCWLSEGIKKYKGTVIGNIHENPELLEG